MEPELPHPTRARSIVVFLLTLSFIAASGFLGYTYWQLRSKLITGNNQPTPPQNEATQQSPELPDETENWKTYTNEKYRFRFKYPDGWEVKSTLENFRFVVGPVDELLTYRTKIDEKKVVYLMMSGPGQTILSTDEWERGGYNVQESRTQINNLSAITRIFTKKATYQKEIEVILPDQAYNIAFDIYNKSLELYLDQILSTLQFLPED